MSPYWPRAVLRDMHFERLQPLHSGRTKLEIKYRHIRSRTAVTNRTTFANSARDPQKTTC